MIYFNKGEKNKLLPALSILIISIGILLRFYHQFISWTYSRDGVLLGSDILNHDFPELIMPLDSFQSAPPLFLLLQKLISYIEPHYISFKFLSFLSSCLALIFFKKLIERHYISIFTLGLLLIFTFNPFVLYHSLTLKQYTFDLTLGIASIYYFSQQRAFFKTFLFFALWCLLSNAGLFFSAAFAINSFIKDWGAFRKFEFNIYVLSKIKIALPYLLAPLPYIIFFVWFMKQPGATEAKNYMTNYWEAWFVPFNKNFVWWIGVQLYRVIFFFYSTYLIFGLIMSAGLLFSLFALFRKWTNEKYLNFIRIYFIAIGIHLVLSALHFYPFSDRLYLYGSSFIISGF